MNTVHYEHTYYAVKNIHYERTYYTINSMRYEHTYYAMKVCFMNILIVL